MILVIAEHDNKQLKASTLNTITAAGKLGQGINVLVVGYQCNAVAETCAKVTGVTKVILVDDIVYEHQLAENLSALVAEVAKNFKYVLAPATTFGKNFLPRVAALLDVAQISDVIAIVDAETFVRPIYAGNALATVKTQDLIKILTIRATAFSPATTQLAAVAIEKNNTILKNDSSHFVSQELNKSARPELGNARVVIAGGRGLQNAENFLLLEKLADKLNAAIGASRAAVDAGFVPNDYQVGQTGKVVAPDLYIAIGISGAIQHVAGMKDSKVIVAINKDPDAPIFQVADYGLVGDLFSILPELTSKIV